VAWPRIAVVTPGISSERTRRIRVSSPISHVISMVLRSIFH